MSRIHKAAYLLCTVYDPIFDANNEENELYVGDGFGKYNAIAMMMSAGLYRLCKWNRLRPFQAPLVGELKASFDQLHAITHPADRLFYKMDKKYDSDEVVIATGSHFMIVAKNSEGASTAVLDYVFARTPASKLPKHLSLTANDEDGEIPNRDPAKAPLKKAMGPLTIESGFMHTTVDEADYDAGGLIFKFKPWTITVAGVYGDVPRQDAKSATHRTRISEMFDDSDESTYGDTDSEISETDSAIDEYSAGDGLGDLGNSNSFTMLFIIFKLEGPLFFVGFADISGSTGGVGVNSSVRLPTAETVLSFPFVKQDGTDTKGGPIAGLKSLFYPDKSQGPPLFTARQGSFWVAAGCKVTAFSMLAVDAVLVLQSNPDVQLGIYGVAIMDVPNLAATVKFAHVELGIITGEAYFTITPGMCMGCGRLHAALSAGPLNEWFDAFIYFLISYRPFHFKATGGIDVGVHFSMDLWLVTVRLSAEISATLSIMGPPMAGTVDVDFWVFGFDINSGDLDAPRLPPSILSLLEFRDLALKTGGSNGKGHGIPLDWVSLGPDDGDTCIGEMEGKEAKTTEPFLFNCNSGLVSNNSVPGTASASSFPEVAAWHAPLPMNTWIVRGAAFSCTITLGFAATEGALLDHRSSAFVSHKDIEITDSQKQLFAQPMQLRDPLITAVTVTITNQPVNRSWLQHNERTNEEWGHSAVDTMHVMADDLTQSLHRSRWGNTCCTIITEIL
ncbi:hypothetical protein SCUP515_10030 [Seiridium cupressi]